MLAQILDEDDPQDPRIRIEAVRALLESNRAWRNRDPVAYFADGHRGLIVRYERDRMPKLGDLAL